jgi:hypothetical protein
VGGYGNVARSSIVLALIFREVISVLHRILKSSNINDIPYRGVRVIAHQTFITQELTFPVGP